MRSSSSKGSISENGLGDPSRPDAPPASARPVPGRAIGRRRCEYDRLPRLDIVRPLATPRLTVTTRPRISRLRHNPIRPGQGSLDRFCLKRQSAQESSSTTVEFKTDLIGSCRGSADAPLHQTRRAAAAGDAEAREAQSQHRPGGQFRHGGYAEGSALLDRVIVGTGRFPERVVARRNFPTGSSSRPDSGRWRTAPRRCRRSCRKDNTRCCR